MSLLAAMPGFGGDKNVTNVKKTPTEAAKPAGKVMKQATNGEKSSAKSTHPATAAIKSPATKMLASITPAAAVKPSPSVKTSAKIVPAATSKPVSIVKPAATTKTVATVKPAAIVQPAPQAKPVTAAKPAAKSNAKLVSNSKPVAISKPAPIVKVAANTKVTEKAKPVVNSKPVISAKPVVNSKHVVNSKPVATTKPVVTKPVQKVAAYSPKLPAGYEHLNLTSEQRIKAAAIADKYDSQITKMEAMLKSLKADRDKELSALTSPPKQAQIVDVKKQNPVKPLINAKPAQPAAATVKVKSQASKTNPVKKDNVMASAAPIVKAKSSKKK